MSSKDRFTLRVSLLDDREETLIKYDVKFSNLADADSKIAFFRRVMEETLRRNMAEAAAATKH